MTEMQYKARNKEDGQIYWLRPVHPSKPDVYFVFKQPHFSDHSYCGAGYCKHYDILEEMPIGGAIEEKPKEAPKEKPKQMNLLDGLKPKAKPTQMRLF